MKLKGIIPVVLILLISCTCVYAEAQNIVPNPGFEEGTQGKVNFWSTYDYERDYNNKTGITEFKWDDTQNHSGDKSVYIESKSPNDARFKQVIKVNPSTFYKISCWTKTEDVGMNNKGANISVDTITDTSPDVKGTSESWQLIELYGKTSKSQYTFTVTLGLGGYGSVNTGKVWFDDINIEELDGIPPGKTVVNLFRADTGNTGGESTGGGYLWIILIGLSTIFAAALVHFILKSKKADVTRKQHVKKGNEAIKHQNDDKKLKFDRKDRIIMGGMTLIYLITALINLGSMNVPQTVWKPVKPGENLTIDLGREMDISRISYFCALGTGWSAEGSYRVEYMDKEGKFVPLTTLQKSAGFVFVWKYQDVSVKTDMLKIYVDIPGGALNEIGIFEKGSKEPLKGIKIVDKTVDFADEGTVENLFDEQDAVAYQPSFMNGTYFDEIYHARTAYEHLNGIEPFESTHPPLGKVFISLGIAIFGMTPFGWRIAGTLFGAAMIPVMYMFGKKLFGKRFFAFCSAFLMMFDFMHFAQTRISTIDVYVTFFVILMFYYMYDYFMKKSYSMEFKLSLKPLLLSGLFFGLGAASKWIALYGAAGLAFLFFLAKYLEYKDYMSLKNTKKARKISWIKNFIPLYMNGTLISCVLFFVFIPAIIYMLSYIPFMAVSGPGHELKDVFTYQGHMYNYHKNLTATHPFHSPWWQWR